MCPVRWRKIRKAQAIGFKLKLTLMSDAQSRCDCVVAEPCAYLGRSKKVEVAAPLVAVTLMQTGERANALENVILEPVYRAAIANFRQGNATLFRQLNTDQPGE